MSLSKSDQSVDKHALVVEHVVNTESTDSECFLRVHVLDVCVLLFPESHVTFSDSVGDQPDLKLGSHFE